MAQKKMTGISTVKTEDYKEVKWVGQTKIGEEVIITLYNAINKENLDWKMADKDQIVANVAFEGCYPEEKATDPNYEPWDIVFPNGEKGKNTQSIILGHGVFYIGETPVGLNRGGGSFRVERKYSDITADGDRGTVVDRLAIDESRPKLEMNVLEVLTCIADLYPGTKVEEVTTPTAAE